MYLAYVYLFPDGFGVSDVALIGDAAPTELTVDRELLTLLGSIKQISLDGTVFENPIFKSLEDFSKPLSPEPIGRPNPFAPLPGTPAANQN